MNPFEFKKLSNTELDEKLKQAITKEREILTVILEHIVEVDRRKLYLSFAYASLFEYLTTHIGYSAGSAQRRIDAARLSKEIPEVISKLEQGCLNLAQVGLLQKSVRQSQSENKHQVSAQTKKQLVENLSGKSFAESQVLVNQSLNISIKESPKATHQQDESVRLELTLTKAQWQKLNQVRELLSSVLPNGSMDQALEYAMDEVITKKSPKVKKVAKIPEAKTSKAKTSELPSEPISKTNLETLTKPDQHQEVIKRSVAKTRIPLTKKIHDQIFIRDESCQFKDQRTGKICGSKWRLQIDHIQPVWAGGFNDANNLRVLCANHNLAVYRAQAGIEQRGLTF